MMPRYVSPMEIHALRVFRAATAVLALAVAACATPATQTPAPAVCADTIDLVFAATTDVHGRLRGWDYERNEIDTDRGLARAATVIDSIRAANPGRVILLDAGDLLQGNMLAYVGARVSADTMNSIVAAMNAMAYDAAAIGNHEYNFGVPHLERAVRQARFPFLSANAYRPDGGAAFAPYTIVERAGVRVGIVGATTPGVMVWDRDNVAGRIRLGDIVPAVREAAAAARRAGAQIVVVAMHSGLNEPASYDTAATGLPSENVAARVAAEVPDIALVVYGHSHRQDAGSSIGSTRLIQAKNWAQSVAVATAEIARCGGEARLLAPITRSSLIPVANQPESPAVVAATARRHEETVRYVTAPLGSTPVAWRGDSARVRDTPIVDFVLEVMRKTTGAQLAGGSAFTFAGFDSGAISIADLARIYPYDNTLRAVRISGAQLRAYLEQASSYYGTLGDATQPVIDPRIPGYNFDIVAGADYALDLSRPKGSRVTVLRFGGRDVQPGDSFTIALNNYRQTGGGGFSMLAGAPVTYEGTDEIRVLLERELRARGTIRPGDYFRQNWRIEPAAAVARAYEAMHQRPYETERAAGTAPAGGRRVRIISTNDFHGALEPRPDSSGVRRGGAAYVATAIRRASAGCELPECETLLLDGGDEWQGTPASNLAYGRPVLRIFERFGLAAAAHGNHEFDWGQDTLRARMREARYGIFGANVRDTLGRDAAWVRNDTIVERAGMKIGIIGLSTVETPRVTRAINVADLRFAKGAPIVDSIGAALRARGADMIVVIAHAGAECDSGGTANCRGEIIDLADSLQSPVDAIVAGHTHRAVDFVVRGMPIIEARSRGEAIAVADIRPGMRGRADAATARVIPVIADSLPPDPVIARIVSSALARVGVTMARRIGTIATTMPRRGSQYALGNLVADAQRWSGKSDVAVMNNGGIRADLRAGRANFGDLYEVQPFGNLLVRFTLTGSALRAYLERIVGGRFLNAHLSGATVRYDSTRAAGSRIVSIALSDGRPLRDDGRYTLVVNDFMATGGDGLSLDAQALRREDLRTVDVDAFAAYLASLRQPVQAPTEVRIVNVARNP